MYCAKVIFLEQEKSGYWLKVLLIKICPKGGLNVEGSFSSLWLNAVSVSSSDRNESSRISSGSGLQLFAKNSLSDAELGGLCKQPILKYPDPERRYVLFTDASRYGWACVLAQPYEEINVLTQLTTDKDLTQKISPVYHPVTFISGLFRGSQLNWTTFTKEAYAIYLLVRKLSFYLINVDHLPLKKFLNKNTMNSNINNWAVGLETYNLKFEYIQNIKNTHRHSQETDGNWSRFCITSRTTRTWVWIQFLLRSTPCQSRIDHFGRSRNQTRSWHISEGNWSYTTTKTQIHQVIISQGC